MTLVDFLPMFIGLFFGSMVLVIRSIVKSCAIRKELYRTMAAELTAQRLQVLAEAARSAGLTAGAVVKTMTSPTYVNVYDVRQDLEEKLSNPYPDKDGDGVPDAFHNRPPLSEALGFDTVVDGKLVRMGSDEYWVAIELPPRPPKMGEFYIAPFGEIEQSRYDYDGHGEYKAIIIKRTRDITPEDLVKLQRLPGEIDSPGSE